VHRPGKLWTVIWDQTNPSGRVRDMAAGKDLVAFCEMRQDQFPALQKWSGPVCHTVLHRSTSFPLVCPGVPTRQESVVMRHRKKRRPRARDISPNVQYETRIW
jgi:hypothetical protein